MTSAATGRVLAAVTAVFLVAAQTNKDNRFKRFWLQLPTSASIDGNRATVHTPGGQQLVATTLLPAGAAVTSEQYGEDIGRPAVGDPMAHRLRVDAPGNPRTTRFLHVLQGADSGAAADAARLIQSAAGTRFTGAAVAGTAVVFPDGAHPTFPSTELPIPGGVTRVLVTGSPRTPDQTSRNGDRITVLRGGEPLTDHGGVLVLTI